MNPITCISCHEMHGGDPRGQLTEKMKTNAACTQCHQQFATPVQLVEHTKHSAESSGSPACFKEKGCGIRKSMGPKFSALRLLGVRRTRSLAQTIESLVN
jgi:predicted CXXCH cytochrome family protein